MMARIGENAAVTESAGAEFHSPAIPRQDASIGNQAGSFVARASETAVTDNVDAIGELTQRLFDLALRVWRTIERDGHANSANGALLGRTENGCAKRRAVIGSRRLDKNVIKHAGFDKLSIGGAVEGHSSGQGKPPQTSAPSERSTDMEHDTIETILKGGSHISVITSDFGIW